MSGRSSDRAFALGLTGAALVAATVVLGVAGSEAYSLAGWPGDPRASAVRAWMTWGAAALVALGVAWSDAPRAVRVAVSAAALLVVIEEGDLPGVAAAGLATAAVVSGALLPTALGAVVIGASAIETGRRSSLAWSVLGVGSLCGLAGAVLVDPRLHGCPSCPGRAWGSIDQPAAASGLTALGVLLAVGVALLTSVAAASSSRWWSGMQWWGGLMVLGGLLSLAMVARSRLSGPLETPTGPARTLVVIGLVLATIGALWPRLDAERRRARLVRAVTRVAADGVPTDVEAALRRALRDSSVRVGYATSSDDLVDVTGAPLSTDDLHLVTVERGGHRVVALAGARRLDQAEADLAVALAWPVLAVQLESARLAVAARRLAVARLASVEEADRAAWMLGRDLHDGAQQRLVSLMIGMRVAADRAGGSLALEAALIDIQAALDEVRRIAHGDLPPILSEQGLTAALADLVGDRAYATVDVGPACEGVPTAVRNTVYLVVVSCLRDGRSASSPMSVRVRRDGDGIRLRVESADVRHNDAVRETVAARVRALGGRYAREGGRLEVELPCA